MARINLDNSPHPLTHEGARASRLTPYLQLRRTVLACLLWEKQFYEDGQEVADRIQTLVQKCTPDEVCQLAIEARHDQHLRHVPLLLLCELAKHDNLNGQSNLVRRGLASCIQRPDEMGEFVAMFLQNGGKHGLTRQIKKGLADAFRSFDAYQLAKWNRKSDAFSLRDVLFLCHAKPGDEQQDILWKQLINDELPIPDTWEVELSNSQDKKESWTRLLTEKKLGGLALLRNLRNMQKAEVDEYVIKQALAETTLHKVLPFRFIAAARYAPTLESEIEAAMIKSLSSIDKLHGKTAIVADNSGSMYYAKVSKRADITRADAAAALAILLREICESVIIIAFAEHPQIVPSRHGFALRDAIHHGPHGGTNTHDALDLANMQGYDRIVVITDEQSHQTIKPPLPRSKGYFINVATYQNGIGYRQWTHIDGWSEAVVNYIQAVEKDLDT